MGCVSNSTFLHLCERFRIFAKSVLIVDYIIGWVESGMAAVCTYIWCCPWRPLLVTSWL